MKQSYLKAHRIPAVLYNAMVAKMFWEYTRATSGVQLYAREAVYDMALQTLTLAEQENSATVQIELLNPDRVRAEAILAASN